MQLKRVSLRRTLLGASLVEVLVSLVLASVGLLALAGMSATANRYSKMSQYRATATLLANDYAERMRANRAGFVSGAYDHVDDFSAQAATPTIPAEKCDASSADLCDQAELAAVDLAQWRLIVRSQLPRGTVFAQRQAASNAMDLWVIWVDPGVAATDEQPKAVKECATDLNLGDVEPDSLRESIRCVYFRVNL